MSPGAGGALRAGAGEAPWKQGPEAEGPSGHSRHGAAGPGACPDCPVRGRSFREKVPAAHLAGLQLSPAGSMLRKLERDSHRGHGLCS